MSDGLQPEIGVADPDAVWRALESEPAALLVDVRTRAEWSFVGAPDLSAVNKSPAFIEWRSYPSLAPNPRFLEALDEAAAAAGEGAIYFICRSGGRSAEAARAAQAHFAASGRPIPCVNVVEGFEGDLDAAGHRGGVNGWKARGLPWRQG